MLCLARSCKLLQLPFGRLWYEDASAAVDYAKHSSPSHDAVIRVYDAAGNVIETAVGWGQSSLLT
jgi:hypothetical protein